jgi:hypothetical protein
MPAKFDFSADYRYQLIGIASSQAIWKVSWELAQSLDLRFSLQVLAYINPKIEAEVSNVPSLFEGEEKTEFEEPELYMDEETYAPCTLYLFQNPTDDSPKETHLFPILLLFVYDSEAAAPPIADIVSHLKASEKFLSVENLSQIMLPSHHKKIGQWLSYWI